MHIQSIVEPVLCMILVLRNLLIGWKFLFVRMKEIKKERIFPRMFQTFFWRYVPDNTRWDDMALSRNLAFEFGSKSESFKVQGKYLKFYFMNNAYWMLAKRREGKKKILPFWVGRSIQNSLFLYYLKDAHNFWGSNIFL